MISPPTAEAQLLIAPQATAQQMAGKLAGNGIAAITNVTYTGHPGASGIFTTGSVTTNLAMDSGIILASGLAITAIGPNNNTGAGTNLNMPGDSLLNTLIPGYTTYDAVVLEFSFIPLSDSLFIRFVFGSEEYPDYANSSFNDVLGIFLSGPNPLGGGYQNHLMSTLPDTTLPVSINNINNGTANNGPCVNCQYYINNTGGPYLQYNGITTPLTGMAMVVPGMTYTLRIAIADAGDGILDSGVFLEEGSLYTTPFRITTTYSHPGAGNVALEGCSQAYVEFALHRPASDTVWIPFDTIFGTATNGVDFPLIGNGVAILPGQTTATINIAPYDDNVTEGIEFISIVVKLTEAFTDTVTIYIDDYTPMTLAVSNDTTLSCGDTLTLGVFPQLGKPPYAYQWSPTHSLHNPQDPAPQAVVHTSTTYTVIVTDAPGCWPLSDTVVVKLNMLTNQPLNQTVMEGGGPVQFWTDDLGGNATYHWQTDAGNGFAFLSNTGKYSGVFTHILTVSDVTAANHNQRFRCLVTHPPCFEHTEAATLTVITSVREPGEPERFSMHPNPASSLLWFEMESSSERINTIELYDIHGRLMAVSHPNSHSATLDIAHLPNGIYLVRLTTSDGSALRKVVKSN